MTALRITLDQEEMPTHCCNALADMVNPPAPPLVSQRLHAGRIAALAVPQVG